MVRREFARELRPGMRSGSCRSRPGLSTAKSAAGVRTFGLDTSNIYIILPKKLCSLIAWKPMGEPVHKFTKVVKCCITHQSPCKICVFPVCLESHPHIQKVIGIPIHPVLNIKGLWFLVIIIITVVIVRMLVNKVGGRHLTYSLPFVFKPVRLITSVSFSSSVSWIQSIARST